MGHASKFLALILISAFSIMQLGCDINSKTASERAIEEQQSKVWLEHVEKAKQFAKRWQDLDSIDGAKYDEVTLRNFAGLIQDYKAWKNQVQIDGKISDIPKPIQRIIAQSDATWDRVYQTQELQKSRIKAEAEARERSAAQKELEAKQASDAAYAAEQRRLQLEAQSQQVTANRRSKLLADSIAEADKKIQSFEERRALIMGKLGNQAQLIAYPSGQPIELSLISDSQLQVKLRVQNKGLRGGQWTNIEEIFVTLIVQEDQSAINDCKYPKPQRYQYKTMVPALILPNQVLEIELLTPRFFEKTCWYVEVQG
jgi:hypothetical protein